MKFKNGTWGSSRRGDANALYLGMHDEIFHFEIFTNFMEILKYFKTPF